MAFKITGAVGYEGRVYRAGQEAELEAAMARSDVPINMQHLVDSGAVTHDRTTASEPAPTSRNLQRDAESGEPADAQATTQADEDAKQAATGTLSASGQGAGKGAGKGAGGSKKGK
jgi:hypothetical protein